MLELKDSGHLWIQVKDTDSDDTFTASYNYGSDIVVIMLDPKEPPEDLEVDEFSYVPYTYVNYFHGGTTTDDETGEDTFDMSMLPDIIDYIEDWQELRRRVEAHV